MTVENVVLLDEHAAVQRTIPLVPGESLFDDLLLAGVPLAYDEDFRWLAGRPDCFDLSIAPTIGQVLAVTGEAPSQQTLLDEDTAELVLAWHSINLDDC